MGSPRCGELRQFAMDSAQLGWGAQLCLGQPAAKGRQLHNWCLDHPLLVPGFILFCRWHRETGGFCCTPAAPGCSHLLRQLSLEERFTGTTVLGPAQHTEPRHQSRHQCFGQTYQGRDPFGQPGLLPQAVQEDAEQPEEDQSLFQRVHDESP